MDNKITTENVVSLVSHCMPSAEQIHWLEIARNGVRFAWRKKSYRVNVETLFVEEISGSLLIGSDEAALIEQLLKKQRTIETK